MREVPGFFFFFFFYFCMCCRTSVPRYEAVQDISKVWSTLHTAHRKVLVHLVQTPSWLCSNPGRTPLSVPFLPECPSSLSLSLSHSHTLSHPLTPSHTLTHSLFPIVYHVRGVASGKSDIFSPEAPILHATCLPYASLRDTTATCHHPGPAHLGESLSSSRVINQAPATKKKKKKSTREA
ncbi:uncharacterized protein LY79DRAFT_208475 [Colletotrichum navitas]|uniref:Secreted protein n=1 Tax=Colletotrichum navitas TaxID=681940 RepID=A0AAD8QAT3_9PEZI|nr:uncharacterized protein LY79DRAFT_208475 [Colletotrichum navitas]KAK1599107.1 hypothetical protein LY79DRAFT_208475 [Colletotrichum navitas]